MLLSASRALHDVIVCDEFMSFDGQGRECGCAKAKLTIRVFNDFFEEQHSFSGSERHLEVS